VFETLITGLRRYEGGSGAETITRGPHLGPGQESASRCCGQGLKRGQGLGDPAWGWENRWLNALRAGAGLGPWSAPAGPLAHHVKLFFTFSSKKKMKFIQGAGNWRPILGAQPFFWPLTFCLLSNGLATTSPEGQGRKEWPHCSSTHHSFVPQKTVHSVAKGARFRCAGAILEASHAQPCGAVFCNGAGRGGSHTGPPSPRPPSRGERGGSPMQFHNRRTNMRKQTARKSLVLPVRADHSMYPLLFAHVHGWRGSSGQFAM
jgi:hypothetical protein